MEVIITSDNVAENWSAAAWDPGSGSLLQTYKHAAVLGSCTLQVLSDSYLLGANSTKARLFLWPLNSQRPVPNLRLSTPGRVSALTCTPNGAYIVAAIGEKLYIWQFCNGRLLATITRHYQTITRLAFSKDGSIFVSAGEDGFVLVWSLFRVINEEHVNPIYSFSDHTLPVKDLCIGHCGSRARLCSVSLDRTLTSVCMNTNESELFVGCTNGWIFKFDLCEPPRGMELHTSTSDDSAAYRGHEAAIVSLSVSTDCRTLLSASLDGKVHLWDVASRQILRTFGHKGQVTSAFFTKRFENFRAQDLKPSLRVQPLQLVVEDNTKESVIEIVRQGASDILDFDSFVENESVLPQIQICKKLENATKEIDRLKMINADIYEYCVKYILEKSKD